MFWQNTSFGKGGGKGKAGGGTWKSPPFGCLKYLSAWKLNMMQLMNGNPPPSVLPSLSRDRCADSMAPPLKELSFMEADLSGRHNYPKAFGCPMYFQAKSPGFMPNIQEQHHTEKKSFSLQGLAKTSFYPDPKLSFACLKKTLLQTYLICKLPFFLMWCTHFTLPNFQSIPPRHLFINTWNQFSASMPLHLTRQQRHLLLAYIRHKNQTSSERNTPRRLKLNTWRNELPFIGGAKCTQVLLKSKMLENWGTSMPSSLRFPPGPRHREVCIFSALLSLLIVLASITLSKAIAEIK